MVLLPHIGLSKAVGYAVQTVVCLMAYIYLKPWRYYSFSTKGLLPALILGVVVWGMWILPEMSFLNDTSIQRLYLTWGVMPFGRVATSEVVSPYSVDQCGWVLVMIRLVGSAFVISVIEEFFWRGFLLRWLKQRTFWVLDIALCGWREILIGSVLFGFEHHRWVVGIIAGLIYSVFYRRTKNIYAVSVAHITTNVALGLYVTMTGAYQFW